MPLIQLDNAWWDSDTGAISAFGQTFPSPVAGAGNVSGLVPGAGVASVNTAILKASAGAGGAVAIPGNLGVIQINETIYLPSSTAVFIGKGTTIKMADGSARSLVFANLNDQTGNSNIYIGGGGTIDCNWQGQTSISDIRQMGLYFCNVDQLVIENLRIINARKYHILLGSATNFAIRDIYVNSTAVGADGVHVHGNSSDGIIERISGTSGDDFIALNVKDVANWLNPTTPALHIGPIRNTTVRKITGNVTAANSGNCVAVYSNVTGTPTTLTGASWANGIATLTYSGTVGVAGGFVQVAGVNPSTWNGVFRVLSSAAGTLTYEMDQDPGARVSGGTVDANYAISGLRIEDIKPEMINTGNAVYLATFPSPGSGGAIDDVLVDDVNPSALVSGRSLALYTCIGTGIFKRIRHNVQSGAGTELIWGEPGFNHEVLDFTDIVNTRAYTGTQGAVCKFFSPARAFKVTNASHLLAGSSTAAWSMTNSASSTALQYESLDVANVTVKGRRDNVGQAAFDLGAGDWPAVNVANLSVSNCVNCIKGNGTSGAINLVINGLQVKNLAAGAAALQFYATGKTVQVGISGYLPRGNVFGAFSLISNTGGAGAVTVLKASGAPNYTYNFPWIKSDTPAAGASLYCDGWEIYADVTKVARWDGAIIRNTNAAAGTLGAAGLVSCQGNAANSWSLMSDPTKKY